MVRILSAIILFAVFTSQSVAQTKIQDASDRAEKSVKPLLIYVGVEPHGFSGVVEVRDDGYGFPGVYAYLHDGKKLSSVRWHFTGGDTSRSKMAEWLNERQVSQSASPFLPAPKSTDGSRSSFPEVPGIADDSPWLSRAESAKVKAAWPKNLKFPDGLKFYDLAPRYQNLWTENGGRFKGWRADELHYESEDLTVSGGMAYVDHSLWRSVKGLDIPVGKKIVVWKEDADVRAFAEVPRWRWQFPEGTVAYDVLLNRDGKHFEIRTQTKKDSDWQTKVIHKDAGAAPAGYVGLNQSCASCHDQAYGQIVNVENRIYRRVRWGSDGRYSWRPFMEDGTIDARWPVDLR